MGDSAKCEAEDSAGPVPGLQLRLRLASGARMGPGRAELLESVARTGSIAAAARAMGMSYRRAWMLLDALATEFGASVVEARPGDAHGGSAHLTELGEALAASFRRIEAKARAAAADEMAVLEGLCVRPKG